jgi:hypothetical protein
MSDASILTEPWVSAAVHGAGAAAAFAAALTLSSAAHMNRGAKANRALILIAIGTILFGLGEGNRALTAAGMPLLPEWDGIKALAGVLLVLFGAAYWRALLKDALR